LTKKPADQGSHKETVAKTERFRLKVTEGPTAMYSKRKKKGFLLFLYEAYIIKAI